MERILADSPSNGENSSALGFETGSVKDQSVNSSDQIAVPVEVKLHISIHANAGNDERGIQSRTSQQGSVQISTFKQPLVDPHYERRAGYDPEFLGVSVPLPSPLSSVVSKMDNGEHVIPYEHFSLVMNKKRRLALFTGSNVAEGDLRQFRATRKEMSGLADNDRESWITDPRIPENHQIPDIFYNKDGGAFDKGHLVRREDVCWGNKTETIRANGDTFHTTNFSPQVAGFNQSRQGGIWGLLENFVLKQAITDRISVFSGPILSEDDLCFSGVSKHGELSIQIPSSFWKIVIATSQDELQAFAFLLEQDPDEVELQFAVTEKWIPYMIQISELQEMIAGLEFPQEIVVADQHSNERGQSFLQSTPVRKFKGA